MISLKHIFPGIPIKIQISTEQSNNNFYIVGNTAANL